jgi:hypothetical protein
MIGIATNTKLMATDNSIVVRRIISSPRFPPPAQPYSTFNATCQYLGFIKQKAPAYKASALNFLVETGDF